MEQNNNKHHWLESSFNLSRFLNMAKEPAFIMFWGSLFHVVGALTKKEFCQWDVLNSFLIIILDECDLKEYLDCFKVKKVSKARS